MIICQRCQPPFMNWIVIAFNFVTYTSCPQTNSFINKIRFRIFSHRYLRQRSNGKTERLKNRPKERKRRLKEIWFNYHSRVNLRVIFSGRRDTNRFHAWTLGTVLDGLHNSKLLSQRLKGKHPDETKILLSTSAHAKYGKLQI